MSHSLVSRTAVDLAHTQGIKGHGRHERLATNFPFPFRFVRPPSVLPAVPFLHFLLTVLPHPHTRDFIMVRSIFAAALLAVSALAIPLKNACDASKASLTLPAGLTTAAGAPSAVLLGVGVQNYTCTDAGTYT